MINTDKIILIESIHKTISDLWNYTFLKNALFNLLGPL